MTFEQRVEMINRMKLKQDTKLLRYVAGITGGLCDANEDSYMVELTFAYYPLTYAGVSCGIEWNDNHGDRPLIERYEDYEYAFSAMITDGSDSYIAIKFICIRCRMPHTLCVLDFGKRYYIIIKWRDAESRLAMQHQARSTTLAQPQGRSTKSQAWR